MIAVTVQYSPEDWQRLLTGNKEAWDAFVLEHAGTVLATVRRLSAGKSDVEAMALEVFASISRNSFELLKSFDPTRASITTWLMAVTLTGVSRPKPANRVPWPMAGLSSRGRAPSPLSTRQNLILMLLLQQGMTKNEIAAALGVSVGTVRSAIA